MPKNKNKKSIDQQPEKEEIVQAVENAEEIKKEEETTTQVINDFDEEVKQTAAEEIKKAPAKEAPVKQTASAQET